MTPCAILLLACLALAPSGVLMVRNMDSLIVDAPGDGRIVVSKLADAKLGVGLSETTPLTVTEVTPGSAASIYRVQEGDKLVQVDDRVVGMLHKLDDVLATQLRTATSIVFERGSVLTAAVGAGRPAFQAFSPPQASSECGIANPDAALKELEDELDKVFGLDDVKKAAKSMLNEAVFEGLMHKWSPDKKPPRSYQNFAFLGPPGTGKTTIAKLLSAAFCKLGRVKNKHFLEVRPDELISEHIGGTQAVVKERLKDGLGGVIFVDEAYLMTSGSAGEGPNQFQQEAVGVLMHTLDEHKEDTVFVFAGYVEDMEKFFKSNEGLKRRIPQIFRFAPFSTEVIYQVLAHKLALDGSGLIGSSADLETSLGTFTGQNIQGNEVASSFVNYASQQPPKMKDYIMRLLNGVPESMRSKMNGGLVDRLLAGAFQVRASRLLSSGELSEQSCMPGSRAFQAKATLFQGICPVVLFYTHSDLEQALGAAVKAWGPEAKGDESPQVSDERSIILNLRDDLTRILGYK